MRYLALLTFLLLHLPGCIGSGEDRTLNTCDDAPAGTKSFSTTTLECRKGAQIRVTKLSGGVAVAECVCSPESGS